MKNLALLALVVLVCPTAALGQISPDSLAQLYEVDFAVPDAPAFELLQVDESNILRPTTVRALTAGLSNLFEGEDGGVQVPNAIAIEAAPFLLAHGPRLTLRQYEANQTLYRTRFSAAAKRSASTGAATGVAVGVRMTLHDDSDLRTNRTYLDSVTGWTGAIIDVRMRAARLMGPIPPKDTTPEQKATLKLLADSVAVLTTMTENFIDRWSQTRWNAGMFDIAAGLVAASADSLGNDLKIGNLAAWGTWGMGWSDWGQLLIGGRGTFGRDDPDEDRGLGGSLGARFYAGTNAYKIFLEGQSTVASSDVPGWLFNTGGEARVYNRLWVNFSAGVNWEGGGDARLTGRFTIKGAAPPLF